MTRDPLRVQVGSMMVDAVAMMAGRKISELPVVDADGKPVGLIDITDVVALLPKESSPAGRRLPAGKRRRGASSANRRSGPVRRRRRWSVTVEPRVHAAQMPATS